MNLSLPKFELPTSKQKPKAKKGSLLTLGQIFEQLLALTLLVLLVISSALAVIYTSYEYRRLFHQQQTLVRESDNFRIEWGQLLLEQSAWGSNSRVEKLAAENIDMRAPDPKEIRLIRHER